MIVAAEAIAGRLAGVPAFRPAGYARHFVVGSSARSRSCRANPSCLRVGCEASPTGRVPPSRWAGLSQPVPACLARLLSARPEAAGSASRDRARSRFRCHSNLDRFRAATSLRFFAHDYRDRTHPSPSVHRAISRQPPVECEPFPVQYREFLSAILRGRPRASAAPAPSGRAPELALSYGPDPSGLHHAAGWRICRSAGLVRAPVRSIDWPRARESRSSSRQLAAVRPRANSTLDEADRRPLAPRRLRPVAIGRRVSSRRSPVSNAVVPAPFADHGTCLSASRSPPTHPAARNSALNRLHSARPVSFVRSGAVVAPLRVAAFPVPSVAGNSAADHVAGSPNLPGVWRARPVSSGRPLHPFRAAPLEIFSRRFHTDSFPCPILDRTN